MVHMTLLIPLAVLMERFLVMAILALLSRLPHRPGAVVLEIIRFEMVVTVQILPAAPGELK
jgi:hypothetical protein